MRKQYLLVIFFGIMVAAFPQRFEVENFYHDAADISAQRFERTDVNGYKCAVIKVRSNVEGLQFDSNIGITAVEPKEDAVWLYVSPGERALRFMKQGFITLDYNLPIRPEASRVYILELVATASDVPPVEIESQWLVITAEPNTSLIYLNDAFEATGLLQKRLLPGNYTYRIENNLYHTETGQINIASDKRAEINISLKPNFGFIEVKSTPEAGARVLIDGKDVGFITNGTSQRLQSGAYTVTVIKEQFKPASREVIVKDSETTPLTLNMPPNFAIVEVNLPDDATLLINNERQSNGKWSGRLNAGVYTFEAHKDKHRPDRKDLQLQVGDNIKIELEPQPITGSLDVVTIPPQALIKIDGKDYGTTPNSISNLLIGEYNLFIGKEDYSSIYMKFQIEDNKTTLVEENLVKGVEVLIDSDPTNSLVTINDVQKGNTPLKVVLDFGKHQVKVEHLNEYSYEDIFVSEETSKRIKVMIEGEYCDWLRIHNSNDILLFEEYNTKYQKSKYRNKVEENILYLKAVQTKDVKLYEEYANRYINGDYVNEILIFLKKHYISEGDRYFNSSNYILAASHYNKYLKYFPDGLEHVHADRRIKRMENIERNESKQKLKIENRNKRIARQTNEGFILYSYDKDSYFGIGIGDLNKNELGWYFSLKTRNFWKDFFLWVGDEYSSNDSYTGVTTLWNCYFAGGINYKVFYPLWFYGGMGFGYSMKLHQYDLVGSKYYAMTPNQDDYGWEAYPESGLILKIENKVVFKYGVLYGMKNNKGLVHQFGVGLIL